MSIISPGNENNFRDLGDRTWRIIDCPVPISPNKHVQYKRRVLFFILPIYYSPFRLLFWELGGGGGGLVVCAVWNYVLHLHAIGRTPWSTKTMFILTYWDPSCVCVCFAETCGAVSEVLPFSCSYVYIRALGFVAVTMSMVLQGTYLARKDVMTPIKVPPTEYCTVVLSHRQSPSPPLHPP